MAEEEEESLGQEEDSLEVEEDSEGDVLEQEEEEEEDSVPPRTVSLRRVNRTTRTYSSMPEYSDSEQKTLLE